MVVSFCGLVGLIEFMLLFRVFPFQYCLLLFFRVADDAVFLINCYHHIIYSSDLFVRCIIISREGNDESSSQKLSVMKFIHAQTSIELVGHNNNR